MPALHRTMGMAARIRGVFVIALAAAAVLTASKGLAAEDFQLPSWVYPPAPAPLLRGAQTPDDQSEPHTGTWTASDGGLAAAPPEPLPILAPDEYPRTGGYGADPAPRTAGFSSARQGGGGLCRLTCAQEYYVCLAGEYPEMCGQTWGQCLRSCPSVTSERY